MTAHVSDDPYSLLQHPLITDDGPQSSEGGSGLHSPVFDAQFSPVNDGFRYQSNPLDIRPAPNIIASHFDYDPTPNLQQPPLIKLDVSPFHTDFSISPRNQSSVNFLPQSPVHSVVQGYPDSGTHSGFTYLERLPGQSYDPSYTPAGTISGISMDDDNIRPVASSDRAESSTRVTSPSTRRKEISTTVIACRQCRARKIRCDSTRPVCNNCIRRSNPCEYDPVPKRRGPDKRPGTRQRSCKKRPTDGSAPPPPKRKRLTADPPSDAHLTVSDLKTDSMVEGKRPMTVRRQSDSAQGLVRSAKAPPTDLRISTDQALLNIKEPTHTRQLYSDQSLFKQSFTGPLDYNLIPFSDAPHPKFPAPSQLVEANQKIWWDEFLQAYPLKDIMTDLSYLFNDTGHWLSFLNLPYFMQMLSDPVERLRIQPCFVLAGLAMSNLMRSSELGFGIQGRNRAMWLRDAAQSELDNAWQSEWVDAGLAEAALILALFETSMHPQYHPDRAASAIQILDNAIRDLCLTTIDRDDRDVSVFNQRAVPVVDPGGSVGQRCSCMLPDSPRRDPRVSLTYQLPWDSKWTFSEIRDEECRRICWNALGLIANYAAQYAAFDHEVPGLFLTDPSNYNLLFPGEAVDRASLNYRSADSQSPKESVWALYCRSLLLWFFCERFRHDPACPDEDRAEFAQEAWNETQSILDGLNCHTCNLDTAIIYMSREYVSNTRMAITQVLRGLQGLSTGGSIFSRKQAEEWVYYQDQVVSRVTASIQQLTEPAGNTLTRRPYQAGWYSTQLALCLKLWNHDRSLQNVLDLGKALLVPVEVMTMLWPNSYQSQQTAELRKQLTDACISVGLPPPHAPIYSLPSHLRNHFSKA